jgi:hypothetical protein
MSFYYRRHHFFGKKIDLPYFVIKVVRNKSALGLTLIFQFFKNVSISKLIQNFLKLWQKVF